jgi:AraC-like DNA-binding protein
MIMKAVGKPVFGSAKETQIWAWGSAPGGEDDESLELVPDQTVFVMVQSGAVIIGPETGSLSRIEAGQMAILNSQEENSVVLTEKHTELLLVGMSRELLCSMMTPFRPGLNQQMRRIVFEGSQSDIFERSLSRVLVERVIPAFTNPIVSGAARSFWYESQVKELIALACFAPAEGEDEFFCSRQKRLSMARVAKAKSYLKNHVDEPLDLQSLAKEVGCSPFYLSRTFSATMSMTISQYVRKLRIEAAAELIVSGKYNISEAAVEVGYQSLSHFSKAFQQVKGCLPSKYEVA